MKGGEGMRKIKFRAWDKEANIMVYSDHRTRKLYDVYYGFEMNGEGELECRWDGEFTESHVLDGGTLDNLMQYTGLKDKNGVEIYEGDIVRFTNSIDEVDNEVGKVIWEQSECNFVAQYKTTNRVRQEENGTTITIYLISNETYREDVEYEVIGNIYENPELLETKKTDRRQAKSVKKTNKSMR